MLVGLETPSNAIPITNSLLSEVQRRGVSRDALLTTLQRLGSELPLATVELLRVAHHAQVCTVDTRAGGASWSLDRRRASFFSLLSRRRKLLFQAAECDLHSVTPVDDHALCEAVCCCWLCCVVAPATGHPGEGAGWQHRGCAQDLCPVLDACSVSVCSVQESSCLCVCHVMPCFLMPAHPSPSQPAHTPASRA